MQVIPYFAFEGNTKEAMELFERAFGAKTVYSMLYKDNEEMEKEYPDYGDKILHATMAFGEERFYMADVFPGQQREVGNHIEVNINFDSIEDLEHAFNVLKEGGKIHREPEDMFWGSRYASVTDKYGNGWSLNFTYPNE